MDAYMLRNNFFGFGSQYYIAGRYAVIAQLLPVGGNLLHHAIEMFMKGELTKHLNEQQRRDIKHKLTELWSAFKDHTEAGDSLACFDRVIERLSKFEDIRYPEGVGRSGMICSFALGKPTPLETDIQNSGRSEPVYQLFLGEIDTLVKAIFDASREDFGFHSNGRNEHAMNHLVRENKETGLWGK